MAPAATRNLSRLLIVTSALEMIDADGIQSLSMRTLGARLGVEAMSLYRYVSGREDLLEAIVDHLIGDLTRADVRGLRHPVSWQEYLQSLAHRVRLIAIEHPHAFPLVATRHPAAPWLRPPLRSLEVVEDFLVTLQSHGFTQQGQVETYRAFSSFLLGQLLLESSVRGAPTGPAEEPLDEGGAELPGGDQELDMSAFPTVLRTKRLLSEDHSEQEFEAGLETLLDRLELELAQ